MQRITLTMFAVAAVAVVLASPTSLAQSQRVLEEIVVTAQKREQSLQEVPIAVSTFSADQLQRAGVNDIRTLMTLSPSLMMTSSAGEAAGAVARIRGIGTTGDNAGLESSVAVFVDGVYRNRNSVALTDLGQIERIEVLRGPQGTLFGKNASAGLIHVITAQPQFETAGYMQLTGGNYSHVRAAGGITAPLIENQLAFRLDANFTQRDGFIDDIVSGDDYNDRDRVLVRGQLLFQPRENFTARIIGDWSDRNETCCAAVSLVEGPLTGALLRPLGGTFVSPTDPYARQTAVNSNRGYQQDVEEWGGSGEFTWDFREDVSLTAITAHRVWRLDRSQDIDYTNVDILYRPPGDGYRQRFETFTQELRVAGRSDRVDWMIGGFYADENLRLEDAIRTGVDYEAFANGLLGGNLPLFTGLPLGTNYVEGDGGQIDAFRQDAKSWAVFTHNTARLTDRLDLTIGMRYTEETKRFNAALISRNNACLAALPRVPVLAGFGVPLPQLAQGIGLICLPFFNPLVDGVYRDKRIDQEWSGTINLAYDIADNINSYISAGRGYKAGGFNLDRAGLTNPIPGLLGLAPPAAPSANDLAFGTETVDAYELGIKSQLFNNLLTLNMAAFYSKFTDFQLNTFTGINFIVSNIDRATTKGVETDFAAFITDEFTLSGGVAYADARYADSATSPPGSPVSIAGRRLTNAPLWSTTLAGTLDVPLGDNLAGLMRVDMRYTGNVNSGSDLLPQKEQGGHTVWNARVGIASPDRRWEFEIWASNLFDKNYQQVAFNAPLQGSVATGTQTFNTFLAEPRTWGGNAAHQLLIRSRSQHTKKGQSSRTAPFSMRDGHAAGMPANQRLLLHAGRIDALLEICPAGLVGTCIIERRRLCVLLEAGFDLLQQRIGEIIESGKLAPGGMEVHGARATTHLHPRQPVGDTHPANMVVNGWRVRIGEFIHAAHEIEHLGGVIDVADVLLVVAAQRVLIEQRYGRGQPEQVALDDAAEACGRVTLRIVGKRGYAHVDRIVVDMQHLECLASPRVFPLIDDLARLRIHIEQDFAADHAITGATGLVLNRHALADVHALDVEQLAIGLARHARVHVAVPPVRNILAVVERAIELAHRRHRAFRRIQVDSFRGRGWREHHPPACQPDRQCAAQRPANTANSHTASPLLMMKGLRRARSTAHGTVGRIAVSQA